MKLEQLISKMCADALCSLGVINRSKPKRGRPKGSKNKKKGKKHANTK